MEFWNCVRLWMLAQMFSLFPEGDFKVNRKKTLWAYAAMLCLLPQYGVAQQDQRQSPAVIGGVWTLVQTCGKGVIDTIQRHPDEKAIQESKLVPLAALGLKFRVIPHPDAIKTSLRILLNDRSRSVIDNYILFYPNDLSDPIAAIVVTEVGPEFDSVEKVLATALHVERTLAKRFEASPIFDRISGPHGPALQMVVPGRMGSPCFPTSDFRLADKADSQSIGISRFVVVRKKLIEFALILRIPKDVQPGEESAYAKRVMDKFWLTLDESQ